MTGWWSSSTEPIHVPAGRVIRGFVRPPSSKSLTHRALAIALLSRRALVVERPLVAEDTALFIAVLEQLGFSLHRQGSSLEIGPPGRIPGEVELDCGNAGTLFRFLVALAATLPTRARLDGTPRLRQRPVEPLVGALRQLGARIDELGAPGCAPLLVHGGELAGGNLTLDASASSQYLSALLLAGQRAAGPVEIEVPALSSAPYVDLTLEMIERFGGRAARPSPTRFVTRPSELAGGTVEIEGDFSAVAYPAAAAALAGGSIRVAGVSRESKQGDRRFLDLLVAMGAHVSWGPDEVAIEKGELCAIRADLSSMPDQVPTLAALAPFARGTTRIENVAHLRIKESDRLAAMASELRRAGARVEELPDGLVIPGVWAGSEPPATPVTIDPHDDHRVAMAMALVALRRSNLSIADPACVAKSYPAFWRDLATWLGATV